jgi:hypothetical protein
MFSINFTLARFNNCTRGGPLDICSLCLVLKCDLPIALGESWVEQNPRFTAVSFEIQGKKSIMVTMPGEPLIELGWIVRNDTAALGFDNTFLMGYSNSHMGYFATPNEYGNFLIKTYKQIGEDMKANLLFGELKQQKKLEMVLR